MEEEVRMKMRTEREEGKDYPFSLFVELSFPLLHHSFFLCISMIKTWWNRAAGRSLDMETMLSPEQTLTAMEQSLRDCTPKTHTHACIHPCTCRQTNMQTHSKPWIIKPRRA